MRLVEHLRHLDNQVLGRPVPDDRPLWQRALRPRPAVWSLRGRVLAGIILGGFFVLAAWGPDTLLGGLLLVPLMLAFFVVIAADERKRAPTIPRQRRLVAADLQQPPASTSESGTGRLRLSGHGVPLDPSRGPDRRMSEADERSRWRSPARS